MQHLQLTDMVLQITLGERGSSEHWAAEHYLLVSEVILVHHIDVLTLGVTSEGWL